VTICVAAMCDGGGRVYGASDRMLSGHAVEFELSQTKNNEPNHFGRFALCGPHSNANGNTVLHKNS
jgi:hypothetical protein